MSPVAELAILAALWCAAHSVLITPRVTAYARRRFGALFAWYRLLYNLFSLVSLLPLLLCLRHAEAHTLFTWAQPWILVSWIAIAAAVYLLAAGARVHDNAHFFGFSQIAAQRRGREDAVQPFHTRGILARVRHPYYSAGMLLMIFAGDITDVNLAVRIVFLVYLIVGAMLEEKKLLAEFGDVYVRYREKVPMFVPRMGRRGT